MGQTAAHSPHLRQSSLMFTDCLWIVIAWDGQTSMQREQTPSWPEPTRRHRLELAKGFSL